MIIQNKIRCNKCGDEPYSRHHHDYVTCQCGAVAVDGGMEYLRRVGDPKDYTELSYSLEDAVIKDCTEAVEWAEKTGRNKLGTALAVLRALKRHDKLIVD